MQSCAAAVPSLTRQISCPSSPSSADGIRNEHQKVSAEWVMTQKQWPDHLANTLTETMFERRIFNVDGRRHDKQQDLQELAQTLRPLFDTDGWDDIIHMPRLRRRIVNKTNDIRKTLVERGVIQKKRGAWVPTGEYESLSSQAVRSPSILPFQSLRHAHLLHAAPGSVSIDIGFLPNEEHANLINDFLALLHTGLPKDQIFFLQTCLTLLRNDIPRMPKSHAQWA